MNPLAQLIGAVANDVLAEQTELNRLDAIAGDGDLGATMAAGANALIGVLPQMADLDVATTLRRCGSELARKAPSTSGTLLATACLRAGAAAAEPRDATEPPVALLARLSEAAFVGIQQRGKADLGDKTMLDALDPAVSALRESAAGGLDLRAAIATAAAAAAAGAEATKTMRARAGRAGWLADRSEGNVDAGAHLVALIFASAASHLAADHST